MFFHRIIPSEGLQEQPSLVNCKFLPLLSYFHPSHPSNVDMFFISIPIFSYSLR